MMSMVNMSMSMLAVSNLAFLVLLRFVLVHEDTAQFVIMVVYGGLV